MLAILFWASCRNCVKCFHKNSNWIRRSRKSSNKATTTITRNAFCSILPDMVSNGHIWKESRLNQSHDLPECNLSSKRGMQMWLTVSDLANTRAIRLSRPETSAALRSNGK